MPCFWLAHPQLPPPSACDEGVPEAFPTHCLPLSLCPTQVVVADSPSSSEERALPHPYLGGSIPLAFGSLVSLDSSLCGCYRLSSLGLTLTVRRNTGHMHSRIHLESHDYTRIMRLGEERAIFLTAYRGRVYPQNLSLWMSTVSLGVLYKSNLKSRVAVC